jgi:hypothetical protein
MTARSIAAAGLVIVAGWLIAAPAQAASMKECAAQWKTMKDAKQTEGKTYREFSKACMAKSGELVKAAPSGDDKTAKPAAEKSKTPSVGRAAAVARQRACGAEWKADKAAGKVEAGMKWPKYWSACNTRKKAEGA